MGLCIPPRSRIKHHLPRHEKDTLQDVAGLTYAGAAIAAAFAGDLITLLLLGAYGNHLGLFNLG